MHVPDGFLNVPTSIATGVVAACGIAAALRGARRELDDKTVPLAGLVAAFVFAAQMINFPVGAGTSGHLMGGAMAAVLVGPWTATLAITVVLVVQCLLFADGGITALGTNVVLLAIVGAWVGWAVFWLLRTALPKRLTMVPVAAALGAFASVVAAAAVFSVLFALGGTVAVPLGTVAAAMVGVHTLIGLGEAVITMMVVGAVVAVRPDLVHGARPLLRDAPLIVHGRPADTAATMVNESSAS